MREIDKTLPKDQRILLAAEEVFSRRGYVQATLDEIIALIDSVSAFPVYYIAVALLAAAEFVCTVWFLASKRKLAFYILAAAAVLQMAQMMIFGSGVRSLFHIVGPFVTWFLLRKSWHVLR